jgi:hypothetical protein
MPFLAQKLRREGHTVNAGSASDQARMTLSLRPNPVIPLGQSLQANDTVVTFAPAHSHKFFLARESSFSGPRLLTDPPSPKHAKGAYGGNARFSSRNQKGIH